MNRRTLLAGLGASALGSASASFGAEMKNSLLELKTWFLHNSSENQAKRVSEYFKNGLQPALDRAGVHVHYVFSCVVGPSAPFFVTLTEFAEWAEYGSVWAKLASDSEHQSAAETLSAGTGAPFVRVESSLLRSFDVMPKVSLPSAGGNRLFEMRTYESPSFPALKRKVGMFNEGEAKIFERLGFAPVFFGETIAGPRQPNLTYMLSYENLAARDALWQKFINDPEWKKLSKTPGLSDADIVSNISNVLLQNAK